MKLAVLETPSEASLDEVGYLSANPDVSRAGVPARAHFTAYGKSEGRKQFSSAYMKQLEVCRAQKFMMFRDVLDIDPRLLAPETFPIFAGTQHHAITDYAIESANPSFPHFNQLIEHNPDGLYMDIGCGFRDIVYSNCLYLEVYPSVTADLIVDPTCTYPIRSNSLDGIGCFAVLEHTRKPWLVVQEMQRMLKPGGQAFIDWPFLQPVHGYPSHFFNATREGLRSIFEDNGFDIGFIGTGDHETPDYTVYWVIRYLLERMPDSPAKAKLKSMTVEALACLEPRDPFWREIIATLPPAAVEEFACGNWLHATKR
jgi:SAM-dependent methyltransferase